MSLVAKLIASFTLIVSASLGAAAPPVFYYDWPQLGGSARHTGQNASESIVSPANVANLATLYRVGLSGTADGTPVYLSNVQTTSGLRNVVYVTTTSGDIDALEACTGSQLWVRHNSNPSCFINNGSTPCYTTSSPAIDPNRRFVYSYGLDGHVHKYAVEDGTEVTGGGWPELATTKPFDEKGSSALTTVSTVYGGHFLYVANGGYPGDNGDYQGHVTTINLDTGSQTVFNVNCSNQTVHFVEQPGQPDCAQVQSAVWARVGVVYDADTNRIYFGTGNGPFDPVSYDWGDSVIALHPNGVGTTTGPLDSFTPADQATLQASDADLGSTAPAILPVPANSLVRHLAVQGGKDALLRLINLDNLSGHGMPGQLGGEVGTVINVPQGGEILSQPAVWVNPADSSTWVFVANGSGTSGLQLLTDGSGNPYLHPVWTSSMKGATPLVANGVLLEATSSNLYALDPATGGLLWHDTSIAGIHWEVPMVADGVLYQTDQNGNLTAFALRAGTAAGNLTARQPSGSYRFVPSSTGSATVGTCAVSASSTVNLAVFDRSGTLLGSTSTGAQCQKLAVSVSAGSTYSVQTTAASGIGAYTSTWTTGTSSVVDKVSGSIATVGLSQSDAFDLLGSSIGVSACGPSGAVYYLYLLNSAGTVVRSATTASNCQSLSYTPATPGLYSIRVTSVTGTGRWSGTITMS
jgi:PQQ-like domain